MTRGRLLRSGPIAAVLMLTACTMGTDEAKLGVAEFRARAARQSYAEIYQTSGPEFRQATTEEQFTRFMSGLERKLGSWQSSGDPGWNVMRTTGGHSVRLSYQSHFAKGTATEQFAWRIQGGQPILLGYHVSSTLLVSE
jgi:hypothetical protein